MSDLPLPEGVTEADYEAIEAAVMETVRGRWFLTEFARRTRAGEISLVVEAVARLEHAVTGRSFPAGDLPPQARLVVQRANEIADRLIALAAQMRAESLGEALCASLEAEARAIAGLAPPTRESPAALEPPAPRSPQAGPPRLESHSTPGSALPADPALDPISQHERRRAALAALDALPTAEKLALFA